MNYRHHLQEAERLLKGKHYASCVQKCAGIFEVAFKEIYQRCSANIGSMTEKKELQRIEEEIGKNQRTYQKFGFGELVGLARKAKLFERLKEELKGDLRRINTINFGSLVDIRNRVTHGGADVQEIDAEIFLTGLRAFLLDTRLMESTQETGETTPSGLSKADSKKYVVLTLGLLLVVVTGLLWVTWQRERSSQGETGGQGFKLMHLGQLAQAEAAVQSLSPSDPRHWEGWSALHLSRGELEKAQNSYRHLLEAAPGRPYALVLQGHLALFDGKPDQAEAAYHSALSRADLQPWQQAECHFGLGRVLLHRNDPNGAVAAFNRATSLDPQFGQAYISKGMALERMGNAGGAAECYQLALNLNAEDLVTMSLHRRNREQLDFSQSTAKRAHIDTLVKDLMQAQTQGQQPRVAQDPWKSKPLSFFFANLEAKGQPAARDGEDDLIVDQLVQGIAEGTRLQLVERALLDRLLEELKLTSFQLADPETAVRVGKILTARIIIAGSLHRHEGQVRINLRAIDTESTKVPATASTLCWTNELGTAIGTMTKDFQKKILVFYPLRARITEVAKGEATIDLGRDAGMIPGMKLRVVEKEAKGFTLEVTSVDDSTCTAALPAAAAQMLKAGWRVEGS